MELNDQQCIAILTEGLNRNLYANQGKVPDDPAVRLKDATDLVQAAEAASRNGNKSENVETILFIARVDQNPLPVANIKPVAEITPEEQSDFYNGLDLSTLSDAVLDGLISGLDKYPNSEQVEADRKAYTAEKERRKNASQSAGQAVEETSAAEAPGEANEKAGEISAEGSNTEAQVGSQESPEGKRTERATAIGSSNDGTADSAQGEDASAFARAQTPGTSEKGRKVKAKPVEEDGERIALESQLTLPIVKAHGIDVTKIGELSIDDLKFIIKYPEGVSKEKLKMAINEQEVEAGAVPTDKGGKSAIGVANVPVEEKVISKSDLGLALEDDTFGQNSVSDGREKLESLITGPILKCYGRGRREIPSIGDNELRFMILNPDGKVSPEDLEKAKNLDEGKTGMIGKMEGSQKKPEMVVTKEILGSEIVSHFIENKKEVEDKIQEVHKDRNQFPLTEVTLPSGEKIKIAIPEEITSKSFPNEVKQEYVPKEDKGPDPIDNEPKDANQITELEREAIEEQSIEKQEVEQENKVLTQNRAMEIISRENMPIPSDYSDEEAPILPMDVSAISRDELFSLHAKFHACESRMLWIMCQEEDVLGDIERLRKDRESVVGANVPFMGEDGKRNTNEYRDFQIASDSEVLELGKQEHEIKKVVKRLKVLCDSYHRSCERLSRQMSKYERERLDAPR